VLLIQESCKLAVEICDDLLNYETFEDDDLPLVIKTLPAALLFHEIVQPFSVQVCAILYVCLLSSVRMCLLSSVCVLYFMLCVL
jgi:hypothetical protein